MKGLVTRKTQSGYMVARVHYSADPDKDPETEQGRAWLGREIQGYMGGMKSPKWQREMEINFRAAAGRKVFEGLEEIREKVLIKPFEIPDWWEIRGGYDWGKSNPFAYVEGTVGADSEKYVTYCAYGSGYEIPTQADFIKKSPHKSRVSLRYADPSIWTEADAQRDGDYTSKQKLFVEEGVTFVKGRTDDIAAVDLLIGLLFDVYIDGEGREIRAPKKNLGIRIFETCLPLWDELINLRWDDFSPQVEQSRGKKETIKQVKNHAWDALKYWLLSWPQEGTKPSPRSNDRALPLAGELIRQFDNKQGIDKWM